MLDPNHAGDSFAIRQVCELAGIAERTLRKYQQLGLLPDGDLNRAYVARVIAIGIFRKERGIRNLSAVKAYLTRMSDAEVFTFLGPDAATQDLPAASGPAQRGSAWKLLPLVPGVDLHVRDDASPQARELVSRILALVNPAATPAG